MPSSLTIFSALFELVLRSDTIDLQALGDGIDGAFVYLLPLLDGSTFKLGFSCNPLQRIYSFHHRYFDRFDLSASLLLRLDTESKARELESLLKAANAAFRADVPEWILDAAGGYTEWFCTDCLEATREQVLTIATMEKIKPLSAFEYLHRELEQARSSFEFWAAHEAQLLQEDSLSISLGYEPLRSTHALRDWLDAFHYFNIELFADDPLAHAQIAAIARGA